MLNISILQLQDIISYAVCAGLQMHEKSLDPLSDRLTKAEARRYILRMGYSVATMKHWEEEGMLTGKKSGEKHNSPVYYSAAQIKELICALKMKRIILDNEN